MKGVFIVLGVIASLFVIQFGCSRLLDKAVPPKEPYYNKSYIIEGTAVSLGDTLVVTKMDSTPPSPEVPGLVEVYLSPR